MANAAAAKVSKLRTRSTKPSSVNSPAMTAGPATHRETVSIHGHNVSYRIAGEGPLLVLMHGITGTCDQWNPVIPMLSNHFTVLAPDLIGHGESAKPRGDYSLGAYASGVRDLMLTLGYDRGTIVGHSLGGGIAMQMTYQYPVMCERLVLVSSGGLGRDVHAVLRAATLPGAEFVIPLVVSGPMRAIGSRLQGALGRIGLRPGSDIEEVARGWGSLAQDDARGAFLHTLRAIVDPSGQRVDARDRLYLSEAVPTLLIWGSRDRMIPVAHGKDAHEKMPGSRFETFETAGHFPQIDDPARFAHTVIDFIESTDAAQMDSKKLGQVLAGRAKLAS